MNKLININIKINPMKKNKQILAALFLLSILVISSCSSRRDCQGNRHRIKTNMGGYM